MRDEGRLRRSDDGFFAPDALCSPGLTRSEVLPYGERSAGRVATLVERVSERIADGGIVDATLEGQLGRLQEELDEAA